MSVTQNDIFAELRRLGLKRGAAVLAHSSLSSFGRVEGGADTVIDAIMQAVGSGGKVLFPTLTGSKEYSPSNSPVFDVLNTPCWTGKIPETARQRHEFKRSAHPTHSVCAWGPPRFVDWFIADHERCPTPCGVGSPYDRLVESQGYILLMGVSHNRNTTMHYVEEIAGVPYHMQKSTALSTITHADGRVEQVPVTLHKYGTARDFTRLEPEMIERGIQVNGMIGDSAIRLIKAREMADLVLARLKEDPEILLQRG